jgi:hypothetical protein
LLEGVRGIWQPSEKLVSSCCRVLATFSEIPKKVMATLENYKYFSQFPEAVC